MTSGLQEAELLLRTEPFDAFFANPRLCIQNSNDFPRKNMSPESGPIHIVLGEVIQAGAFDYLPKDPTADQIQSLLRRINVIVELKNEVEHLKKVLLAESGMKSLRALERTHIENVLAVANNQEKAAEILGITTVTLWRKRKEYNLP
jgi:DNA-binding NtrC family response regulator